MRDEDVISRVLEVVMPMWNGKRAGSDLTVEALEQIQHPALALYEANSVCLNALEELRDRMPRLVSAVLPGGKIRHFTGLEHPELIVQHMKAFWHADRTRPVLEGA